VLEKEVTDLEVDLLHSALGSHHQAGDWIAMMPGTVALEVSFTLRNTDGNETGDGTFVKTITNEFNDVIGDRTSNGVDSIFVQREIIPDVAATIEFDDATDVEHPPVVSTTLPSLVRCNPPETKIDLSSYVSASDPDGDLDTVGWIVDDKFVFADDELFGNGTYTIAPVAFDDRGAVDLGAQATLTVANCP